MSGFGPYQGFPGVCVVDLEPKEENQMTSPEQIDEQIPLVPSDPGEWTDLDKEFAGLWLAVKTNTVWHVCWIHNEIKKARQDAYSAAIEDAAVLCETGRFIPIERPAKEKLAWSCALTEAATQIRALKPTNEGKT